MSNMSYCRFQNTSRDLVDCRETLQGLIDGEERPLSREELAAAKRLVMCCSQIIGMMVEYSNADETDFQERDIDAALDMANNAAEEDSANG